jgi:predicted O-methyltransferase YrrM
MADENLHRGDPRYIVDLLIGDATEVVASLPGPFDFVFFDADRVSTPVQLALLVPKLAPDTVLLAVSYPEEISGHLAAVESLPGFDHLVVPIGKGLGVPYREAPRDRDRPAANAPPSARRPRRHPRHLGRSGGEKISMG